MQNLSSRAAIAGQVEGIFHVHLYWLDHGEWLLSDVYRRIWIYMCLYGLPIFSVSIFLSNHQISIASLFIYMISQPYLKEET